MEFPVVQNPFELIIDKLIKIESQLSEMQGKASPEILDLDQACEETGFSKSFMYKCTSHKDSSKRIPHYKSGKKLLFRRSELIAYMLRNPQNKQNGIVIEK